MVAMQPRSLNDCFLAHTKFHALIKACTHQKTFSFSEGASGGVAAYSDPDNQAKCILSFSNAFVKECKEEAIQNVKEKILL